MSKMSDYDLNLQEIRAVMSDPILSAEEQLERKCDWLVRELDEICGLANNPETIDLVEQQRMAIGQMKTRIELIAAFLMARQPRPKVVVNNG
jgi:hypothetical protein